MSERTGLRYGLLGLIVIALLAALAYFVARPPQTPAAAHAAAVEENQLQSLKDVAKQAPVHRKLDIQARTPLPSPPASRTSAPRSATVPTATWRWPACAACPTPTSGPRR